MKPSEAACPDYIAALAELAGRIQSTLTDVPEEQRPIRMIVAGGAAMHCYTGARTSLDVDASFSHRLVIPPGLQVAYRGTDGKPMTLYFDYQYNDAMGLQHEDAHEDSLPLELPGISPGLLDVRLLTPVDLALSKLSRFSPIDRGDIAELAERGLIDAESLRRRAETALAGYIGNQRQIRMAIDEACTMIKAARPPAPAGTRA